MSGVTLTYPEEAIGIVKAAENHNLPVVICFTVGTDGKLPCGISLQEAIETVDKATNDKVLHYGINCAHLTHFKNVLQGKLAQRIGSVSSNASKKSHEELDDSEELHDGDPEEFGREHADLVKVLPNLRTIGGCCGTDLRHIQSFVNEYKKM